MPARQVPAEAKKLEEGKSKTFTMIGTPHYMAPEACTSRGRASIRPVRLLRVSISGGNS